MRPEQEQRGPGRTGFVHRVMAVLALLSGALFFFSYLGVLHPAGDSFAVIRLPLGVVFALCVIWSDWTAPARWIVSAAPILGLAHLAMMTMITGTQGPVTVYQKNLLFKNGETGGILQDIRAQPVDLVFLQEVLGQNDAVLAELQGELPAQLRCAFTTWAEVAVLSRWPQDGEGLCLPGIAALPVQGPEGRLWAVSLHLHWPWPYRQASHLARLEEVFAQLDAPVILGGDFNMVPWGHALRRVAGLTNTVRAGAVKRTIIKRGAPIAIDHILAPHGGWTEVRPRLGSDHFGVLGRVWLTPPGP